MCDDVAGIQEPVDVEAPEPFGAVMCVEIIRACGLLAAVNEASIWLGGGKAITTSILRVNPKPSTQVSKRNPTLQTSWKHAMSIIAP